MPSWLAAHRSGLPLHPHRMTIWIALLVLVLLSYLVTALSLRKGQESVWRYLWFGFTVTMLANVAIPHLPATLILRQYTPGVVTAMVVNLPVMSFLLRRALQERWVSGGRALRYALFTPVAGGGFLILLFAWT